MAGKVAGKPEINAIVEGYNKGVADILTKTLKGIYRGQNTRLRSRSDLKILLRDVKTADELAEIEDKLKGIVNLETRGEALAITNKKGKKLAKKAKAEASEGVSRKKIVFTSILTTGAFAISAGSFYASVSDPKASIRDLIIGAIGVLTGGRSAYVVFDVLRKNKPKSE